MFLDRIYRICCCFLNSRTELTKCNPPIGGKRLTRLSLVYPRGHPLLYWFVFFFGQDLLDFTGYFYSFILTLSGRNCVKA